MIRNKSHDNPNICEKFTLSLAAKKSFSDLKFSFPEVFLRFLGNRPDQFGIWDQKLPDSALNWREKREAVRRNGAGDGEMKDRLMSPVTKRVRLAADRERARVWSWAESLPLHMVVWAVVYGLISGRPLGDEEESDVLTTISTLSRTLLIVFGNGKTGMWNVLESEAWWRTSVVADG